MSDDQPLVDSHYLISIPTNYECDISGKLVVISNTLGCIVYMRENFMIYRTFFLIYDLIWYYLGVPVIKILQETQL